VRDGVHRRAEVALAMIRVCYMVDAPFLGGAERYVSRVALGLDRRAFLPSLVVREPADDAMAAWVDGMEREGIRVVRVPMRLPFRPGDARGILAALDAIAPDLVHVNMPGPYDGQMGILAPLARMAGVRAVVTTEHLPMVERLWKRALVKRVAYRAVDCVVTVCRANVPYLTGAQSVPAWKVRVVPNGVRGDYGSAAPPREASRARFGLPAGDSVVAFVGNLLRHKGLHRVIEALPAGPDARWHLVVAGSGPEEAVCRELAEGRGVAGRVTFLGALAPADVEALLAGVDVLALPSTIEGMPYVVLEAMASGVAVVAGAVFGIPEMIDDGVHGYLVNPTDAGALRAALERLLRDRGHTAAMGAAARARFRSEFTLERQLRAMESLYQELAGRRVPRGRET